MAIDIHHQAIIDELYALYKSKGFIREDEALNLLAIQDFSLQDTEKITGMLLGMGVIFADDNIKENNIDRAKKDYEVIYCEVLKVSSSMSVFVDYLRGISPPQWREWHVLIPQAQAGNIYAHNRLFDMYLRVVVRLALQYHKSKGYELEDLVQEGSLGLVCAIKKFNSEKHDGFPSYLTWWVTQYMDRAISKKSQLVRIPIQMQKALGELKKSINKFEKELKYVPSISYVAKNLNMRVMDVRIMLNCMQVSIPLGEIVRIDNDDFIEFDIADENISSPFYIIQEKSLHILLESALKMLTNREEEVIRWRYGLGGEKEKTLNEISESFGRTRERIRQIEFKALETLQHFLKEMR